MHRIPKLRSKRSLVGLVVVPAVLASLLAALSPLGNAPALSRPGHGRQKTTTMAALRKALAQRYLTGHGVKADGAAASVTSAAAALAVFGRPRTTSDAVPVALTESLVEANDPQQSREAFVANGNAVFLIPSEEGVCLVDSNRSQSGCFPMSMIRNGGGVQSTECGVGLPNDETIQIAGVLPDQARQATVLLSDGSKTPLKAQNNAFLADFARKGPLPTQIELQMPSGTDFVPSTVPSDVATENCVAR
jgi:hypothetical protein